MRVLPVLLFGLLGVLMHTPSMAGSVYGDRIKASQLADNDKDGVINVRDRCANTPRGAKVDNYGCPTVNKRLLSVELNILFDSGKYVVKPRFYGEVKKLADFMKSNAGSSVVIEGHTDDVGAADYNEALSQNRADAIADVLINSFKIDRKRVEAIGYGESKPIADNETIDGRATNRRVVAEVFANKVADVERWTIYSVDRR
ncbi:OmpA family protein [Marinomonas mediterranea]|nr:OmpA family protein [Marinomonas mediterranea]WCN11500.1 OmpA family protein [Marinomonas mediterranea]WCN15570.1 OmpA family protein [Marinomonas mediterranea]WCN19664.1 OmpA family protein [Marinomonas mediterranea MMB-1]